MKGWDRIPWSLFSECWALSQLFQSPLILSSRGSLVPLCFLSLNWYHLLIWDCWYFSQQSWFQLVNHPVRHFSWCTLNISYIIASLVDKIIKNLPAMRETQVWSLEKGMANYSNILAWRILWTEEPGGLYIVMGSHRVRHDWATNIFTFFP